MRSNNIQHSPMDPGSAQFQERLARMEDLINALNAAPDSSICLQARELVQTLLELHAGGFEKTLDMIYSSREAGQTLIDRLAEDPLISNLLVLHNLHPLDLETRVRSALESVKPRLGLHGGNVELIGVTPEGGIKLRLEGNCHGCPSSRVTLKSSIEEAIYAAAPDVTGLEVEGAVDNFVNAPDSLQPKFTVCPTDNEQKPTTKRDP
jgi:Fe-S cluster biogenesis protein NfuA